MVTLSECLVPLCGISSQWSALFTISGATPSTSFPPQGHRQPSGRAQILCSATLPLTCSRHTILNPRERRSSIASAVVG